MNGARTSDRDEVDDENPVTSFVTSVLVAVRGSFLAFVTTIGVLLLLTSVLVSGFVAPNMEYGLVSAMALIWGVSALIYAVLGNIGLRVIGYR